MVWFLCPRSHLLRCIRRPDNGAGGEQYTAGLAFGWRNGRSSRRPGDAHTRATTLEARDLPFTAGRLAGMDDLLDALHALGLPSVVLSLAALLGAALSN